MKKTIIYVIALALPIWVMNSCTDGKQGAKGAGNAEGTEVTETKDPTTTENTPLSDSESEEASDEEMELPDGMYDPAEIAKNWKTRTIKVPGQKSDIVALFEAFYTEWPTLAGNRIVHETNPSLAPDDTYYEEGSIIDRKNGYVESAWYEGEDLGIVSACVWNRKNGHKLFAVNFNVEKDFLCFYDFDPAKQTLTPEESPIKREHLNNPDKEPLWYTLPQEGKTLEVVEDTDGEEVASTYYTFDGQNLKYAGHER